MGKNTFLQDFKAFAMKGNVIDMAVGVVIGGAFGKIVSSLVERYLNKYYKTLKSLNKMIKVGINGFGRIGRFVFRAAMERNDIQIVGINDLCPVDYLAYMLKYDTMHGQFDGTIEADVENSKLIVNGQSIRITAERNPADLKWDARPMAHFINKI